MRNKKGVALLLAIYAFLFVSILTACILLVNQKEISSIFYQSTDKKSLYLADGGIEEGIYSLKMNGGFLWELGDPDYGPGNAYGGSGNSWGTQLKGDYFASSDQSLITPEITIPSTISNTLFLTFYRWVRTEDAKDGAFVRASFDGGVTWSDVSCTSNKNWYNSYLDTSSPYGHNTQEMLLFFK